MPLLNFLISILLILASSSAAVGKDLNPLKEPLLLNFLCKISVYYIKSWILWTKLINLSWENSSEG